MKKNIALVLYYANNVRCGLNAIAGALETDKYFNDLKIYFIDNEERLISEFRNIIKKHRKTIVGISFFTSLKEKTSLLIKK